MKFLVSCLLLIGVASRAVGEDLGSLLGIGAPSPRTSGQTTCLCGWTNRARIVGGVEATANQYPWMVALHESRSGSQFCGGSIITPFHVLTAAHCTADLTARQILINVGAHSLQERSHGVHRVSAIINHEQYNERTIANDIALVVSASRFNYNQNVGPVCLPNQRINLEGQRVRALGWGRTLDGGQSSNVLRKVDLRVIPFRDCLNSWRFSPSQPRQETNMCTFENRMDTCQGDSGGPLVFVDADISRFTLAALVSYGGRCAGSQPGVNTDVSAYLEWINRNVAATSRGANTCSKV